MQIEEVKPEQRVEGFVRKFDVADFRDIELNPGAAPPVLAPRELNLYLTLTRATDAAPPEEAKPSYINPYDDPFELYRKVPKEMPETPPVIKLSHQVVKALPYKDPRDIKAMVRDVLRSFREHPQYMKMGHVREYQEATACFQLRCAVVQWPDKHVPKMSEQEYADMIDLAAKHLTLVDCPAQETVQLQITTQAAFHFAMKELDKDTNARRAELDAIMKVIIDTKVIDIRKYYETAEVLRERVIYYLFLYSKFVDPFASTIEGAEEEMKAEIEVALESVFPRKGFLYWMDIAKEEKEVQLQELAEVVTGVRVFNKYEGKGGHYFQFPHQAYEHDALCLGEQIHDTLDRINEKVHAYSLCIEKYYLEYGVHHMFIKRLRDEIAFQFQAGLYLEPIQWYLCTKQEAVSDLLQTSHQHLDRLLEIIGSYEVIPSDMVFPELRAIGALHISIAQEFRYLQARIKAATPLLEMANKPFYRESPHTEKRLDAMQKNFLFLPMDPPKEDIYRYEVTRDECKAYFIKPDKVDEVLAKQPQLEYSGFCPVYFVRSNGVLWKGDPDRGLVQTADMKLYAFVNEDSQSRFMKAPCKYITDVAKLVLQMPQYVHLMNLQGTPAFLYLSIPKILETDLVNELVPKDYGTQTDVHPWVCRWDREKLGIRKLQLQKLRTHCTQTEISHFRRENVTQVVHKTYLLEPSCIFEFTLRGDVKWHPLENPSKKIAVSCGEGKKTGNLLMPHFTTYCIKVDVFPVCCPLEFTRGRFEQTYPPKDKWTNTGISRFTDMPRHIKVLHGLRGHMHNKMHTIRASYEHTSIYNPWKLIDPPSEPITEPKC